MTRELQFVFPATIVYVTGTINDVEKTFTLSDGVWKTIVDRTPNDIYNVSILAVNSLGVSSELNTIIYYGLNLITDRTEKDVIDGTEKGFYNYTDLNRVESACVYVADYLNQNGNPTTLLPQKIWSMQNFPNVNEMNRYLNNVKKCKNQLGIDDEYFKLPQNLNNLDYKYANAIEKCLLQTVEFVDKIKEQEIYSGEFNSGVEW